MNPIRVALASPNDVLEERAKVKRVVTEINPLLDRVLDVTIALRGWEDLPPEFSEAGPQAIIDKALRFEDADLFVAVFGGRLGQGTMHELRNACSDWSASGKPEIMVYFHQMQDSEPGTVGFPAELPEEFKDLAAKLDKALWGKYKTPDDLERKLRLALIEHALKRCGTLKASAPSSGDISWFAKCAASAAQPKTIMKDLQIASGDICLTLRNVAPEYDLETGRVTALTLAVEGKAEGYATLKEKFQTGLIQNIGPLEIQDVWRLDLSPSDFVQPLFRADSHLLQVLVRRFSLSRAGSGIHVRLEFDRRSPAIWRRESRGAVRAHLGPERKLECQKEIDDVVEGRIASREFADSDFPFRHANGGVLPIFQFNDRRYYCLFYRETDPIGWNIANGGSDDSDELIDPRLTILRELREELIMVGPPTTNERYTFSKREGEAYDRPEYLKALDLWKDIVGEWPSLGRSREDVKAEIEWEEGAPDTMTILAGDYGVDEPEPIDGVYVNVTAEDCAIEADKVAILRPQGGFLLLDGEVYGGKLVNRPIGLFETSIFSDTNNLENPPAPNVVFYSGRRTDDPSVAVLRDILEKHFDRQKRIKLVTSDQVGKWEKAARSEKEWSSARPQSQFPQLLRLCPITRSMISRHIGNDAAKASSASSS